MQTNGENSIISYISGQVAVLVSTDIGDPTLHFVTVF